MMDIIEVFEGPHECYGETRTECYLSQLYAPVVWLGNSPVGETNIHKS